MMDGIFFSDLYGSSPNYCIEKIDSVSINGFRLDADIASLSIESENTGICSRDGELIKTIVWTEIKLCGPDDKVYLTSILNLNNPINILLIKGIIKSDKAVLDEVKIYYSGRCNIYCKIIKDDMETLQEYVSINKLRINNG